MNMNTASTTPNKPIADGAVPVVSFDQLLKGIKTITEAAKSWPHRGVHDLDRFTMAMDVLTKEVASRAATWTTPPPMYSVMNPPKPNPVPQPGGPIDKGKWPSDWQ